MLFFVLMERKGFKNFWKKFWFFVWKDQSLKGWIVSIVFLFLIVKFIFFPFLNLVTGTSLPLAIVESCSMYHDGNILGSFDDWWERHEAKYSNLEISKTDFEDFIFKKGFNKGDILFVLGTKPENIDVGDVIIFEAGTSNPVIHRVVDKRIEAGNYVFSTIGDNNYGQFPVEVSIREEQIIGRAVFKLAPYAGWVKLIFYEPFQSSEKRGLCGEN